MKLLRTSLSILLIALVALVIIYSESILLFGVDVLHFGWMSSYILPKALLLILTSGLAVVLNSLINLPKSGRIVITILLFAISVAAYLVSHPPYVKEWQREGTHPEKGQFVNNSVVNMITEHDPHFDGLVCVALTNCKYCGIAVPKMEHIKRRNPDVDLMVVFFTKDSSEVETFSKITGVTNLAFRLVPDEEGAVEITNGKFPSFFYLKNGKIIRQWANDEFGYPALDLIESKMNNQ